MRLLLFAPCAHAPWTEGRKNLVRDICDEWRKEHHSVVLLAGFSRITPVASIAWSLVVLSGSLLVSRPDRVFQFPFGTFRGVRGRINLAASQTVRWMCRVARVPLLTVLYSADGIELPMVPRIFGRAAACTATHLEGVVPVRLGTRVPAVEHAPSGWSPTRILFLCGYQSPSQEVVESVLQVRGLGVLLDAFARMDRASLTIAIPFLRHAEARKAIERELASRGLGVSVVLDGTSAPLDLLRDHDAFVFPYAAEHALFVPTSLLEAMMVGIPVVACDRSMYRNLTNGDGVRRCKLAEGDSPEAIAAAIEACLADYGDALTLAAETRAWVRAEWSIAGTARQLLASY